VSDNTNLTYHPYPLPNGVHSSIFWEGILRFLFEPILQNNSVNDLAAEDASPSEEFLTNAIKFFEDHCTSTPIAFHDKPPSLELADFRAIFVPNALF
jgi:hypothetical protein